MSPCKPTWDDNDKVGAVNARNEAYDHHRIFLNQQRKGKGNRGAEELYSDHPKVKSTFFQHRTFHERLVFARSVHVSHRPPACVKDRQDRVLVAVDSHTNSNCHSNKKAYLSKAHQKIWVVWKRTPTRDEIWNVLPKRQVPGIANQSVQCKW